MSLQRCYTPSQRKKNEKLVECTVVIEVQSLKRVQEYFILNKENILFNQDLINLTLASVPEESIAGFSIARNLEDKKLFDVFVMGFDDSTLACVEVGLSFEDAAELQSILNFPYETPVLEEIKITKTLFNPK